MNQVLRTELSHHPVSIVPFFGRVSTDLGIVAVSKQIFDGVKGRCAVGQSDLANFGKWMMIITFGISFPQWSDQDELESSQKTFESQECCFVGILKLLFM